MKILILGGTGAMGISLTAILNDGKNEIFVTSRSNYENKKNVQFLKGNAQDYTFLKKITEDYYDCIIDFMDYLTPTFEKNIKLLLKATKQYIFLSSSRVYADSQNPITEQSKRLIDVYQNQMFMDMDEYPLHKAEQENLLKEICQSNNTTKYTIIRPYITYNKDRLQLGVAEKERWLYRALKGRTIVFPKDVGNHITTLTYGYDVALMMSKLIQNPNAYNETFHIAGSKAMLWNDILQIYCYIIEKCTKKKPKVCILNDSKEYMQVLRCDYQMIYDRLYDRRFDNKKIDSVYEDIVGKKYCYLEPKEGLEKCLKEFINNPVWRYVDPRDEAYFDHLTGEVTSLKEFNGLKRKIKYIFYRMLPRKLFLFIGTKK